MKVTVEGNGPQTGHAVRTNLVLLTAPGTFISVHPQD